MPEYPDITVYVERMRERVQGQVLRRARRLTPFVLRTAVPPIARAEGRLVTGVQHLGKRVVLALQGDWYSVIHLMVAGHLRWLATNAKPPSKSSLARFEFDSGQLVLTEAGTTRRASIHLVDSATALAALDPGDIDVMRRHRPLCAPPRPAIWLRSGCATDRHRCPAA